MAKKKLVRFAHLASGVIIVNCLLEEPGQMIEKGFERGWFFIHKNTMCTPDGKPQADAVDALYLPAKEVAVMVLSEPSGIIPASTFKPPIVH